MHPTPPVPLPPVTETAMNENMMIKRIVGYLELHCNSKKSIDSLAQDFGVKRRGLYDFLSICSTFGICERHSGNLIEWHGIDRAETVMNSIREQCRSEPSNGGLQDIFTSSKDASLQRLAVAIIKLFFSLKVKFLDLRKASRLFAQHTTKYKTMLRKLYTVAAGLELAGIIRKTRVVSQIQLIAPLDAEHGIDQFRLESILNTKEELKEEQICAKRRKEFENIGMAKTIPRRLLLPPPLGGSWE
jgi:hypothetical protein